MFTINVEWVEVMMLRKVQATQKKRARILSGQIEKLGEQLIDALQKRDGAGDKADTLEKKLLEQMGKVRVIRRRQPGNRTPKPPKQTTMAEAKLAVELALSGNVEQALAFLRGAATN